MEQQYKSSIINQLESWAETFNNSYPDHEEEAIQQEKEAYEFIHSLIDKYSKDICTKEDYEAILFHLWQIGEGL